jgi:uncharacterized protein (TIGR02300 family)
LRPAKGWPRFPTRFKDVLVAKTGLGTKRLCPHCGAKFYDLSKDPIVCPKCGSVVEIVIPNPRGGRSEARAAPSVAEPEVAAAPDAELVSLEEADAETAGAKAPVAADDDEDEELADDGADDTFLEEGEDEDEDVSDIIGGDIEDEEET